MLLKCLGYFISYNLFSFVTKYYMSQKMPGMEYLFHSTMGSLIIILPLVLVDWWPGKLERKGGRVLKGMVPEEVFFLTLSGICTGFIVPTTTLMYTFGFNVMVAMIIMRGTVIPMGWAVNKILIYQKKVTDPILWQENMAVVFSLLSVGWIILGGIMDKAGSFDFLNSWPLRIIMILYLVPYGFRLYFLNNYKKYNSRGVFGVEQLAAVVTMGLATLGAYLYYCYGEVEVEQVSQYVGAVLNPDYQAMVWTLPLAGVALFSVFLFIDKKGSAVFNTAANRLTSLMAGATATYAAHKILGLKAAMDYEWTALSMVAAAIIFLAWAAWDREIIKEAAKAKKKAEEGAKEETG